VSHWRRPNDFLNPKLKVAEADPAKLSLGDEVDMFAKVACSDESLQEGVLIL